jgi:MFS family permease
MALGLVLSGPLWGRMIDRHNALVGVAACLLAAAVGVLVLIYDQLGEAAPFWHAILFLPLSFAEEGVIQARNRYLSVRAPGAHRPLMLAVSSALLACASIVVAVIVGIAGHLHDIRTPLVILILFSLVAAAYTRRVFAD